MLCLVGRRGVQFNSWGRWIDTVVDFPWTGAANDGGDFHTAGAWIEMATGGVPNDPPNHGLDQVNFIGAGTDSVKLFANAITAPGGDAAQERTAKRRERASTSGCARVTHHGDLPAFDEVCCHVRAGG